MSLALRPKTKARRRAEDAMYEALAFMRKGDVIKGTVRQEVPDEWHLLEFDHDVTEKKEKITLYLDRSVARCFKAMGKGYQERINALLRTWMQMKIGEFLEVDEKLIERFDRMGDRLDREAEARKARMGAYTAESLGWEAPEEG
jgi:uncharacterized protein (DUF4415 family)